jgi:hypothetical protein
MYFAFGIGVSLYHIPLYAMSCRVRQCPAMLGEGTSLFKKKQNNVLTSYEHMLIMNAREYCGL